MPNHFTAHKAEWKQLADIDYFSMFVKAYIPFNAWMNVSFSSLDTDRAKINEIKRNSNTFRDKIRSLLCSPSQDGIKFKGLIGELHGALEENYINNQDKRLTFTEIILESNRSYKCEAEFRGIKYHAHCGDGAGRSHQTVLSIKKRNGDDVCAITLAEYEYNFSVIEAHPEITALIQERREKIMGCYRDVAPLIKISFLENSPVDTPRSNYFQCGSFTFIRDEEKLCKGLIEILYNLRNSLLHGEIIPNAGANEVYKIAYHIMRTLIEAL